ncbi:hypothetical protein G4B88_014424 [Cannabis sativa]|uniref:Superoxide dismutase copper chaperone n=1 Tax=Cannabis sativa TaxID=3483 RepID=A0A7J6IA98_CANSA|nr:hypothetical protein G4B88_014424 [Cannabis sativa]
MAFLRSLATTTAIAATIPLAYSLSSSSSSSSRFIPFSRPQNLPFLSSTLPFFPNQLCLARSSAPPSAALQMAGPASESSTQSDAVLPELLTEYMVDMKCEGCVNAVKNKLQTVNGVKSVEVDLSNQVLNNLLCLADFLISAAVAEFKGPEIFGVVRLAQVNMELARIEANFSGLSPGKHGWSINEFGDLTNGAASTGKVFNTPREGPTDEPVGDLRTLDADEKGEAFFSGVKPNLRVAELIGRSIAIYKTENRSDSGIAAAVIARSAGVGENYKKLCTCDGTTIWEATNSDFVTSKV